MKPFFYIAVRKHLEYRSAVRAVGEKICPGHFVEECLYFFRGQSVASLYSSLAGHGGKDVFQHCSFFSGVVGCVKLFKKIEKEFGGGGMSAKGGNGRDDIGAAAEFSYAETHFIYFLAILFYLPYIMDREFHGLGKKQGLAGNTIAQELPLQLFKEQPFVGCMLINNDKTTLGLTENIEIAILTDGAEAMTFAGRNSKDRLLVTTLFDTCSLCNRWGLCCCR